MPNVQDEVSSTSVQFGVFVFVVGSILILAMSASSSIIHTPSRNFVIGPHVTSPSARSHCMLDLFAPIIVSPGSNDSWPLTQMSHFL